MKKIANKIINIVILTILILLSIQHMSFATIELSALEYSQEYKEYLALSEEEKQKVIMPNMYDNITKTSNAAYLKSLGNTFKITQLLKSSLAPKYNLKNIIPENMTIKNQGATNGCWAFAILGGLESNLAIQNQQKAKTIKVYDFSERHMVYATAREAFLNNAINEYGFTKTIAGGNNYIGNAYLTNGIGAITEEEMPFKNNEDKIQLSEIQNKTVATELVDSQFFAKPTTSQEKESLKAKVKEHITNYGGVATYIYGAQILSEYYNNTTGAIYCDNAQACPENHEVLIIGWDDNYSKEKFNQKHKPKTDGAWIIKNSWGEKQEASMQAQKTAIYNQYKEECKKRNWNSASDIPNEFIIDLLIESGYAKEDITVNGDTISLKIGDKGYMYISYEDVNVFNSMYGIIKATDGKQYNDIYQYDTLGCNNVIVLLNTKVGYLANVFERKEVENEMLTKISINSLVDIGKCTVFLNPNGSEKDLNHLQEVKLAQGDYETIRAGYNTIEFANPIKLNGSSFVIVLKVENDKVYIPIVSKLSNSFYEKVELKTGKSFIATESDIKNNLWTDLTSSEVGESYRGNIALKAFTTNQQEQVLLESIKITKAPEKTTYQVGENFNATGMKVIAYYTNGTQKEVENYKVTNGENLQENQTSVTITYTENEITKTTLQSIKVQKPARTITKIEIQTKPKKLEYIKEVEELNLTGGVIKVIYSDSTTEEISMTDSNVKAKGYDKTKVGEQTITITYKEKEATFKITVKEGKTPEEKPVRTITKIEIQTKPKKLEYTKGVEELNLTGGVIKVIYSDSTTEEISMTDSNVKVKGYNKTKVGEQTITITYKEKEATFKVIVKDAPKVKEEPTPSSFENAKANIIKSGSYLYIKKDKTEYTTMTISVSDIKLGDKKSNRTYYYYISGKQGENNIKEENWTKVEHVTQEKEDFCNILMDLDSRTLINSDEIKDADNLYIYIKEDAILNNSKVTTINSLKANLQAEVEIYLDDIKQSSIEHITDTSQENLNEKNDSTVVQGKLPQTGEKIVIIIGILITIMVILGVSIKLKKMKDIK